MIDSVKKIFIADSRINKILDIGTVEEISSRKQ